MCLESREYVIISNFLIVYYNCQNTKKKINFIFRNDHSVIINILFLECIYGKPCINQKAFQAWTVGTKYSKTVYVFSNDGLFRA